MHAGTLPPSLAALAALSVLRLGGNQLGGDLGAFAASLQPGNRLSIFNVSSNKLRGEVPTSLAQMGLFTT